MAWAPSALRIAGVPMDQRRKKKKLQEKGYRLSWGCGEHDLVTFRDLRGDTEHELAERLNRRVPRNKMIDQGDRILRHAG